MIEKHNNQREAIKKEARARELIEDIKAILGKNDFLNDFKPLMREYTDEWIEVDSFAEQLTSIFRVE